MTDPDPSVTETGDLGPRPEPEIEPREPNPGGVDALPEEEDNISADLDPDKNPAVEEAPDPLREAFTEGEDTDTEATKGSGEREADDGTVEESPA